MNKWIRLVGCVMRNYRREANHIIILGKWEFPEVSILVDIINEVASKNETIAEDLGKALQALDRAQQRLEWYRDATLKESKVT
jgi:hypothetical protein